MSSWILSCSVADKALIFASRSLPWLRTLRRKSSSDRAVALTSEDTTATRSVHRWHAQLLNALVFFCPDLRLP